MIPANSHQHPASPPQIPEIYVHSEAYKFIDAQFNKKAFHLISLYCIDLGIYTEYLHILRLLHEDYDLIAASPNEILNMGWQVELFHHINREIV